MRLEEGAPAPAFELVDQLGRATTLASLAGRNVILYFYPRDDTPGCTKEACGFRDLAAELSRHDAVVVGVSPDGAESHRRFADKHRLPFTLLADPSRSVLATYRAFGDKVMYGKKVKGVIRSTVWIGPDGRVRKHWPRVAKAADHPAEVLAALAAGAPAAAAISAPTARARARRGSTARGSRAARRGSGSRVAARPRPRRS